MDWITDQLNTTTNGALSCRPAVEIANPDVTSPILSRSTMPTNFFGPPDDDMVIDCPLTPSVNQELEVDQSVYHSEFL